MATKKRIRLLLAALLSLSGEASYDVATPEGTIQVFSRERRASTTHDYAFSFSGGAGSVRVYDPYDAIDYGDLDATGALDRPRVELGAIVTFLKGFGVQTCRVALYDDDALMFKNVQKAQHAEITRAYRDGLGSQGSGRCSVEGVGDEQRREFLG